ncbi:MAG TPA: hypothetical protein VE988_05445 [Gemmataceae bacterium]|nr:hypothetical protein [Gemmataceae bacterium]
MRIRDLVVVISLIFATCQFLAVPNVLSQPPKAKLADLEAELAKARAKVAELEGKIAEIKSGKDADKKLAGAIVMSYLSADGWEKRLPFVLNPEKVEPLMRVHYKGGNTASRDTNILTVDRDIQNENIYLVTAEDKTGKPYGSAFVVRKTTDGFKVDWPASVGYNETPLAGLRANFPDKPVKIRVLAKIGDYYNFEYQNAKNTHFNVSLRDPKQGNLPGYVAKTAEEGKRLYELLKDGKDHELIVEITALGPGGGSIDAGHGVAITRVVSESWYDPSEK